MPFDDDDVCWLQLAIIAFMVWFRGEALPIAASESPINIKSFILIAVVGS